LKLIGKLAEESIARRSEHVNLERFGLPLDEFDKSVYRILLQDNHLQCVPLKRFPSQIILDFEDN
jgi:hypothetical protein